jgi:hypothetical protein
MSQFPATLSVPASTISFLMLATICLSPAWPSEQKSNAIPVVRWTDGAAGSSFSRTDDGKYRYDLKDHETEISIAIDSQELEKVRHRPLPIFAIRLDAHYSGQKSLELDTDHIALEFVDHYQVVNSALDPDELGSRIQNDIDNLTDEIAHEVRKHPEKKQEQELLLQTHLKDLTDLVGFISLYCLRPATLDAGNPVMGGWVFFSAKSKWIGRWKSQEEFVLRVPIDNKIFEFPFALPSRKGELILRRREN